jgi:MFS family permease
MSSRTRKTQVANVIQVSSGNFLEMYDFMVFGHFASAIGETYFPTGDHFASLMSSLMTFGVGFLMRPIGALILGAYIDRYGRRAGLILTLALMSVGTFGLAFTPGFAVIGIAALLHLSADSLCTRRRQLLYLFFGELYFGQTQQGFELFGSSSTGDGCDHGGLSR